MIQVIRMLSQAALFMILASSLFNHSDAATSNDWPQWRGPSYDGISKETGWNPTACKKVWSSEVGTGFSAVSISKGLLYTMGNKNERDIVTCLNAKTGKPVWSKSYPSPLKANMYDGGPNTTPTVNGGVVFTLSKNGHLHCYGATDGREIWKVDVAKMSNSKLPQWGFAGSPLIAGNLVIVNVGSHGLAVHNSSGKLAWKSPSGQAGYASPTSFSQGQVNGVAIFSAQKLVAVHPKNGAILFEFPWKTSYDVNAADPVFFGKTVFISSGYNGGCILLDYASGKPKELWKNKNLNAHCNGPVLFQGHLYGGDGNVNSRKSRFVCMDIKTGAIKWAQPKMNGQCIVVDGKLIITDTKGALIIAKASPDSYQELARTQAVSGICWTVPVLANGLIYVRNSKGHLVCFSVVGK